MAEHRLSYGPVTPAPAGEFNERQVAQFAAPARVDDGQERAEGL
jgi:hypothetical protein